MTAIKLQRSSDLANRIDYRKRQYPAFGDTDLIKFASSSRPKDCSDADHRELKSHIIEEAASSEAVFFGYGYFNEASQKFDADRNRLFGFNTLLWQFQKFLTEKRTKGFVVIDRLDLSKKGVLSYKNGFDYLREKSQKGNEFDGTHRKLKNIIGFSMGCEGSSNLSCVNDVLTGSLRYVVNGKDPAVRATLQKELEKLMWSDAKGAFRNYGLKLHPKDKTRLEAGIVAEYDLLRKFLNTTSSTS